MLLNGCNDDSSSSSATAGNTTTTTSTVDETPVFEGFKYLNTAKGVDPRQQEAALSKISGITNAKCDGYECSFTFSGRGAVFVYPPEISTDLSTLNVSSVINQDVSEPVVFTKKLASSKNTLSTLADASAPVCPTKAKALIIAALNRTYFKDDRTEDNTTDLSFNNAVDDIVSKLKQLAYEPVIKRGSYRDFEEIKNSDYGMVIILTHGAKDGMLLAKDNLNLLGYDYITKSRLSADTDIQKGLNSGIYSYFYVGNMPDDAAFIGITPKWWDYMGVSNIPSSENRIYFFEACSVFNKNSSGLSKYFENKKLNGVGFELVVAGYRVGKRVGGMRFIADILAESSVLARNPPFKNLKDSFKATETSDYFFYAKICKSNESAPFLDTLALNCARLITPDSRNLYLSPNACSTATTPIPQSGAPVISNFIVPASGKVNQLFTMDISYSDPNGNNDVVKAIIQADDDYPTLHPYTITNGNGLHSITGAFDSAGQHWVNVYVVDNAGNKSNEIKKNITITADPNAIVDYKVRVVENINGQQVPVIGTYISLFSTGNGIFAEINNGGKTTDANGRITFNLSKGSYSASMFLSSIYIDNSVALDSSKEVVLVLTRKTGNTTTSISGTYNGTKIYTTGAETGKTYNISLYNLSSSSNQLIGTYTVNAMPSTIENGRISGNTISFTTKPYFNLSCVHSFTGTVSGNVISGSFTTVSNCNGSGTWRVTK